MPSSGEVISHYSMTAYHHVLEAALATVQEPTPMPFPSGPKLPDPITLVRSTWK